MNSYGSVIRRKSLTTRLFDFIYQSFLKADPGSKPSQRGRSWTPGTEVGIGIGSRSELESNVESGIGNRSELESNWESGIGGRSELESNVESGIGNRTKLESNVESGIGNRCGKSGSC